MVARQPKDFVEEAGEIRRHSPSVESHAQGASIINVETVGKGLLIIIIVMLTLSIIVSIGAMIWASNAAATASIAAERAQQARNEARIASLYATQVYTELNRLGYPVKSPAEFDHELHPENTE